MRSVGLRRPQQHLAFAAIDGLDPVRVAQADQRPAVVGVLAQQALEQQLIQQIAPLRDGPVLADAEGRQTRFEVADLLGLAEQVIDDTAATKAPAQPVHCRQRLLGRLRGVLTLRRAQEAEIALAVGPTRLLAEIAAHGGGAAVHAAEHGVELADLAPLHALDLIRRLAAIDAAQGPGHVGAGKQGDALGQRPIAPGPADLLPIGLDRGWRVQMDDKADVGFVDAHAKGDGRHHHRLIGLQEFLQAVGAQALVQSGVIGQGRNAGLDQGGGHFLGGVPRAGVDDARASAPFGDQLQDALLAAPGLALGGQLQFGAGEAVDEFAGARPGLSSVRMTSSWVWASAVAVTASLGAVGNTCASRPSIR